MQMKAASLAICLWLGVPAVYAQDYRAEIMSEVIDPCYLAIIRHEGGIEGMSEREALEILKLMQTQNTESMSNSILPLVRGKDLDSRKALYRIFLKTCIQGSIK